METCTAAVWHVIVNEECGMGIIHQNSSTEGGIQDRILATA